MRGESGVAGEGRVVGVPKFHFWGKCTMPLTNINSDWMSNASSGLCINLFILIVIGASLSEPHTSVTAFAKLCACLSAAIYRKF